LILFDEDFNEIARYGPKEIAYLGPGEERELEFEIGSLPSGRYYLTIQVIDAAGNLIDLENSYAKGEYFTFVISAPKEEVKPIERIVAKEEKKMAPASVESVILDLSEFRARPTPENFFIYVFPRILTGVTVGLFIFALYRKLWM